MAGAGGDVRLALSREWRAIGLLTTLAVVVSGCAAPGGGTGGRNTAHLYVANGADGTISRMDSSTGLSLGPALPAGYAPNEMALGPHGNVLVQSTATGPHRKLTFVRRTGQTWEAIPLYLGEQAHGVRIAGDGGRYAVVLYHVLDGLSKGDTPATRDGRVLQVPPGIPETDGGLSPDLTGVPVAHDGADTVERPCRLALVDLVTGQIKRTHAFCTAADTVYAVAMENSAAGPIAYLALWRWSARIPVTATAARRTAGGRLEVIHAETGAPLGVSPLAGFPGQVLLAPSPGRAGLRLYCVEGVGGRLAQGDPEVTSFADADRWQVLRLDPVTLDLEREYWLPDLLRSLAITADGRLAYALGSLHPFGESMLWHLDLDTGKARPLDRVPGASVGGLAVTADRIYVPDSQGNRVVVLDGRDGRVLKTVPVGRHPLGIILVDPFKGIN
jgi:YVTN family beta-propeller protein